MTTVVEHGFDVSGATTVKPSAPNAGAQFLDETTGQVEHYDESRTQWNRSVGCAVATYDFASDGGAISAISLDVIIPNNAVIWDGYIDVVTTCTSGTDAATIAIHAQTANDLVSAVAISAATDWDAGLRATIPVGTVASGIKLTADRTITATIAVEAVTAGKFHVVLFYITTD